MLLLTPPPRFTWSQAVAGTLLMSRMKASEFTESGQRTTVVVSATQGAQQRHRRCSAKTSACRCRRKMSAHPRRPRRARPVRPRSSAKRCGNVAFIGRNVRKGPPGSSGPLSARRPSARCLVIGKNTVGRRGPGSVLPVLLHRKNNDGSSMIFHKIIP